MKTIAFVPIKLNNQRTPGKNTKKFSDGTPLITAFLKTLVKCEEIDEIYVFCSDETIKDYLIPKVNFLKRPSFLDTDKATANNLIQEFMKIKDADVYVMCNCTSPFVTVTHISECCKAVKSGKFDSSFTGEKIQKLLWKDDGNALNFDPTNVPRTQDLDPLYSETTAIYAFSKKLYETKHRRIGGKIHITEVKGIECVDIDYPEDFEIANAIYSNIIVRK